MIQAATAGGPVDRGESTPPASATSTPPASLNKPMDSAVEAVALARSDTEEFKEVTRAEAKKATWGTLRRASDSFENARATSTLEVASSEPVWVVAVSGDVVPEFAERRSFNHGIIVYDAKTSAVLGMSARNASGAWPKWFDDLTTGG